MKALFEWFDKIPLGLKTGIRELAMGVGAIKLAAWMDSTKTAPEVHEAAKNQVGELTIWKRLGLLFGKATTFNRVLVNWIFTELRLSVGESSWLERLCTWANNVAHGPFQLWQAFPELTGTALGNRWTSEDRIGRFFQNEYEEYQKRNQSGMGRMLRLEAKLRASRTDFFSDMLGLSVDDGIVQETLLWWRRTSTAVNGYAPQMQQVATWIQGLAPAPTPPPAPGFLNWLINLF